MDKPKIVDVHGNPMDISTPLAQMVAYQNTGSGFADELASWNSRGYSSDAAILPTLNVGNARAADISRNHAYAKSGVQLHIDHIVGEQFKLVYNPNVAVLGLERDAFKEFIREVEARFTDFAEDPDCYMDAEEKRTFTMFCREAAGTHCKTGEITSKAEWNRSKRRATKYQTMIKNIDYARISNPNDQMDTDLLRGGVKLNANGAAQGYYVTKSNPNDHVSGNLYQAKRWVYQPKRLPWGRTQILHIFEPEGSDQTRGANALLTGLAKMKMLEKYQSTTLQNAIINAQYAATIESEMPTNEIFAALGSENVSQSNMARLMQFKAEWANQTNMMFAGAKVNHLLPNEKLTLNGINAPSASLTQFETNMLRYIAASLGVSYEEIARDFSKTNYSSARASLNVSHKFFMGKRATLVARYASMIFALWFEEALNKEIIKLPAGLTLRDFYENKNALTRAKWIGSGRGQIDGLKEVKESIEKIKGGLSTYEKEIANFGDDYVEVFEQQYREAEMLAEHGRKPLWMADGGAIEEETDEEDAVTDDGEESPKAGEINENPEVHGNA